MTPYNCVEDFEQALDVLQKTSPSHSGPRKPTEYIKRCDFDSASAYYLALAKDSGKYDEDLKQHQAGWDKCREAVENLRAGFKAYCIKSLCSEKLPSFIAEKLYQQAWESALTPTLGEVYLAMEDIADLVNDAYAAGQAQP
jgi:hypothetical protein